MKIWILAVILFQLFAGPVMAVPLDFDGDGVSDLTTLEVQRDGSANELLTQHIRSSDGATVAVEFGKRTDLIIHGDYDSDGVADLGYARALEDNSVSWVVRLSGSGNQESTVSFGTFTDRLVSGCDFDGDGKADPAFIRESTLFVRRSSDASEVQVALGASDYERFTCGEFDGVAGDELLAHKGRTRATSRFAAFALSGAQTIDKGLGRGVSAILAIDSDGNGVDEIAFTRDVNSRVEILTVDAPSGLQQYRIVAARAITVGRYISGSAVEGIFVGSESDNVYYRYATIGGVGERLEISRSDKAVLAARSEIFAGSVAPEVGCVQSHDPFDGPNGYLWKPASDFHRTAVTLLPSEYRRIRNVRLVKAGVELEKLRFSGVANGNRPHFRSAKLAATFPEAMTVMATDRDGTVHCWALTDPTIRHD